MIRILQSGGKENECNRRVNQTGRKWDNQFWQLSFRFQKKGVGL